MLKKGINIGFLFIAFGLLLYSVIHIFIWFKENEKTAAIMKTVTDEIKITQEEFPTTIIQEEETISEEDPYWDFIAMPIQNVEFHKLEAINSDTVGWLKVNGTNINYPIVQSTNNTFYLTHDFYKAQNGAGWVFLDYRNNPEFKNQNNIIYAHGRANGTMFGSLKNVLSSTWQNNTANFAIELSTKTENTVWQVFSVYKIKTTNDYIETKFKTEEQFKEFITTLKNRSIFDFKTTVSKSDLLLTLSTCYTDEIKVVLHAKLIKAQQKM